ncbi:hypothetical protein, partial [Streptococcus pneumoniae]|uniref:hypothetical protein n=1 Tax=Streptococcus pneumoniae TaxID=1313 RepID=UPI0019D6C2D6
HGSCGLLHCCQLARQSGLANQGFPGGGVGVDAQHPQPMVDQVIGREGAESRIYFNALLHLERESLTL